ncbi:MAG: response regulator [Anaerolineae bacterium]|nr:response regulator [Anaerolineae bacterium]
MTDRNPILVVEDDPDGQAVVRHILEYHRWPVVVASNGERASDYLFQQQIHFSAAIVDLALPGMDGWQLLAAIRQNPATASLLCVAVTAFHSSKTRAAAIKAGFDAYIPKPVDSTGFIRTIDSLLSERD